MNPETRKQAFVIGLFVILGGVLVYQFVIKGTGAPAAQPGAQKPAAQQAAEPVPESARKFAGDLSILEDLIKQIREVRFEYLLTARDNESPMKPQVGGLGPGPIDPLNSAPRANDVERYRVSGIIWDEKEPRAVVEGVVVWNGYDYKNGLKVVRIERNRVWFDLNGDPIPVGMEEL